MGVASASDSSSSRSSSATGASFGGVRAEQLLDLLAGQGRAGSLGRRRGPRARLPEAMPASSRAAASKSRRARALPPRDRAGLPIARDWSSGLPPASGSRMRHRARAQATDRRRSPGGRAVSLREIPVVLRRARTGFRPQACEIQRHVVAVSGRGQDRSRLAPSDDARIACDTP